MVTVYLAMVGVLVCGIGYFLYTPFPDYMDQPWELQKVNAQIKIGAIIAAIAHTVGFGEKLDLNRKWTYKWALLTGLPSNYLEKVKITDTTFDGVPVRMYRPVSAAPAATLPALVYYHGGGWVLLDVETYDSPMAEICRQANIVVISVEYRLAPEHTFPKGFDDCVTATKHVLNNGISYGVNPNKIAVGVEDPENPLGGPNNMWRNAKGTNFGRGDSAGGNLAAALTIKFRDEGIQPRIKAQLLIYPSLQVCSHSLPMTKQRLEDSADEFIFYYSLVGMWLNLNKHQQEMMVSGKYITPELAEKCKRLVDVDLIPANLVQKGYVHDDHVATPIDDDVISMSKLIEDARVSPLLVEDLSELPRAYVFTAQWDYIRDHGIIYAKRLEKVGNAVVWHHETDTFHGVLNTCHTEPVFKICPKLMGNITEFLTKAFAQ